LGCALLFSLGLTVLFGIGFYLALRSDEPEIEETVANRLRVAERRLSGKGAAKIAVIPIEGFIGFGESDGMFGGENLAERVIGSLQKAAADPAVKAVVLRIDSPGGGITASDAIHHELTAFTLTGKKAVAFCGDLAASGAYYIACAADRIVVHPTGITGNIGVIMHTMNVAGLMNKLGLQDVTIKSGDQKDILSPFRPLTEQERAGLQAAVDEMFDRFIRVVMEGRNLPEEEVRRLADGRIFTGAQARALNLADAVGYEADAIAAARELCGEPDATVVEYRRTRTLFDLFRAASSRLFPRSEIERIGGLLQPRSPRLLYLWSL
jgi:protease-4